MSGTKTIVNKSAVAISVILRGRVGADPASGSLPPVSASIPAGHSATLQYGNAANPYLNSLDVEEISNGSDVRQTFTAKQRGGPGTLDNLFNVNGIVEINYNPASYGFSLAAHN